MVICFSVTNLQSGGAQVFIARLATEIAQKFSKPVYIYDHQPESRNKILLEQLDPRVKIVSYCESSWLRWLVWKINATLKILKPGSTFRHSLNLKRFEAVLRKHNVTVLNSHMSHSDFNISEVKLPARCKLVLTLHGEYELLFNLNPSKSLDDKIIRSVEKAAAIIYTADKNLEAVLRVIPKINIPFNKIGIGFDKKSVPVMNMNRADYGIGPDDFVVGMISRGIEEKGWQAAISAVIECNEKNIKKIWLICIGEGEFIDTLFSEPQYPQVIRLRFKKNYHDYYSAYQLFDLFVLPTWFAGESFPNVIIESLSWNVPVVATKWAEIPNMLETDKEKPAGICIPVSDNLSHDLADVISMLVNDGLKLSALKEACPAVFDKFSMHGVSKEYLNLFEELLAE